MIGRLRVHLLDDGRCVYQASGDDSAEQLAHDLCALPTDIGKAFINVSRATGTGAAKFEEYERISRDWLAMEYPGLRVINGGRA